MLGSKVCRLVRIDSEYTPNLEQVASRPDERVVVARTLVFAQGYVSNKMPSNLWPIPGMTSCQNPSTTVTGDECRSPQSLAA